MIRRGGTITGSVSDDPYHLDYYSYDASGHCVRPACVALPRDASEVSGLVRLAVSSGMSLTPRGAGTGLAGGALGNGMILDTSRMDYISYDEGLLHAGPGARLGAVACVLRKEGRILGFDPSVGPYCSVGGMVATNASGPHSLAYGSAINNLESVTLVDGRGDVVELPSDPHYSGVIRAICRRAGPFPHTAKNSCGYRLDAAHGAPHRVVAASEGTLGVVTGAVLRTYPAPRRRLLGVMRYDDVMAAARDCPGIAACHPAALEIAGPGILGGQCTLMAEFHDTLSGAQYDMVQSLVGQAASVRPVFTHDVEEWMARRRAALSVSLRGGNYPSMIEDAAVPPDRLPDLFGVMGELGSRGGDVPLYYGHAGSGNIHVRTRADPDAAQWYLEQVIQLGGTITGEHGDGMARAHMVKRQYGGHNHALFWELKDAFDPHHIMNPGKVVI